MKMKMGRILTFLHIFTPTKTNQKHLAGNPSQKVLFRFELGLKIDIK